MEKLKLGLDIGGTEVKGGVVDSGKIIYRVSHPTDADKGLSGVTAAIIQVVRDSQKQGSFTKIGVSSAGQIDFSTGKVIYASGNLPGYTGFDLAGFIKKETGLPAICDNDAYCAMLGEYAFGAAKGFKDAVMVTLGTGVGGAAIINGQILRGENYGAARFGHMNMRPGGAPCNCGKNGCAEVYLSGKAFTLGAKAAGFDINHGSEVFNLKNNERAAEYIRTHFDLLSVFIDSLYLAFGPQAVIIGGGMINSKEYWWDNFLESCGKKGINAKILPAVLGNNAGIVGASELI